MKKLLVPVVFFGFLALVIYAWSNRSFKNGKEHLSKFALIEKMVLNRPFKAMVLVRWKGDSYYDTISSFSVRYPEKLIKAFDSSEKNEIIIKVPYEEWDKKYNGVIYDEHLKHHAFDYQGPFGVSSEHFLICFYHKELGVRAYISNVMTTYDDKNKKIKEVKTSYKLNHEELISGYYDPTYVLEETLRVLE